MLEESPEQPPIGVGHPAAKTLDPMGAQTSTVLRAASENNEIPPSGWTYWDLFLLLLLSIPALIFAVVITSVGAHVVNYVTDTQSELKELFDNPLVLIATQLVWWAILLGFIYAVITVKYHLPFWDSLGWHRLPRPVLHAVLYCCGGIALAFSVASIAQVMPMPTEQLPIEKLLRDRQVLVFFAVFGVIIAPVVEEITFRGFLYPVVERSYGKSAAVLVTSVIFSALHAPQYGWHWQILLLLLYVGIVFGALRSKTGSMLPSTLTHCGYNATLFTVLIFGENTSQIVN